MCSQTRQQVSSQQPASASLWLRLIIGLVSVSLLAIGAASGLLYIRFKAKNVQFHEETLRNQAGGIVDYLKTAPDGPILLPAYVTQSFKANAGKYAIVAKNGELLAASAGVSAPLAAINSSETRDSFVLQPDADQLPYYGLSERTPFGARLVWVQVAFHAGNIVFDSVLKSSSRILLGFGFHSSLCFCLSICSWHASVLRHCGWPQTRLPPLALAPCPPGSPKAGCHATSMLS
jgi:hypothetical protein